MRCTRFSNTTPGFTLVEMLVIAPIVLLTIAIFIGVLLSLTGETLIARTNNSLAYSVQDSLNSIEYDISLSGAFLATNSVAIASPQGYNNASQVFQNASTATGNMLIINTAATTDAPSRNTRQIVPLRDMPYGCSSSLVSQNQVMTYNIVYFVKDNTLWRRTLMPSNYETRGCAGTVPWQQPSCAPGQSGGLCRTEDMKMLEGITSASFTIQYFTSARSATAVEEATAPANSTTARQLALSTTNSARISISATRMVAGKEVSYSGTLRVTRAGPLSEQTTPVP